ncbi:MAG: aminomethyl-transferring glycine dehydrogenase subunit GcvPA [Candidatus Thorarchaeota archaeon]
MMPTHPYIPNSVAEIRRQMLKSIGVKRVEDLFASVPERLKMKHELNLPTSMAESEVRKTVENLLRKNITTKDVLSFLGAGCWPHYVPAICDEINSRSEFVTAYTGEVYSDLGRYQALFEFQSMIGDLVDMDVVTFPLYDWTVALADAARMALKVTGRDELLVPKSIGPTRLEVLEAHTEENGTIRAIDFDLYTGRLDIESLKEEVSRDTAAIYIENPTYFGVIETEGDIIGKIAHEYESLFIVGVDPITLGILKPPGDYGADIVCGEGQPLGMHMNFGSALLGFLACKDDEQYLHATGHRLVGITETKNEGEWGFGYILPGRTMFGAREKAATYTGTASVLWAITAAVYLAALGPVGLRDLGELIMQNSQYAMKLISEIDSLEAPIFNSPHFKEFTVRFSGTERKVQDINESLLSVGIQGGKDLSSEFPELGNTALYCVTEMHSQRDIETLANLLAEVLR